MQSNCEWFSYKLNNDYVYRGPHPNCTGSLSILLSRPVQLGCGPLYSLQQRRSDRNCNEIVLLLSNTICSWLYIILQSRRTAQGFFRSVFCSEQISNINNGKAECGLIFSPVDTFENSNLLQMVE